MSEKWFFSQEIGLELRHDQRACISRTDSSTTSRVFRCVASRSTGGAQPSSSACFHLFAQRHHLSPGFRPGNRISGLGVVRSLPALALNVRNASSTTTHTVWVPRSLESVLQQPSLNHPVSGSSLQVFKVVPRTLIEGSTLC